jgi:large subunit ribosomal protein L17
MRHLKSGRKLKRTASHRRATLSALSSSLIHHKKIRTTLAKAKETRRVVEKLITRARNAVLRETSEGAKKDTHARRVVFSFLRDRKAVSALFNEIAPRIGTRPGGYTRVVKLGRRHGDGAELAVIELVDYNTGQEKQTTKASTAKVRERKKAESRSRTPKHEEKESSVSVEEAAAPRESQPKDQAEKSEPSSPLS